MPISERYLIFAESPLPERERTLLDLPVGATWADGLVARQYRAAIQGEPGAAKEIREAIEGKAGNGAIRAVAQEINIRIVEDPPITKMLNNRLQISPN
jgi:hypothetical protein